MKESETIVANWTHGERKHSCESSKDNVPAVARLGRTGGLARSQAATLRNHCSVVTRTPKNAVCEIIGRAEPVTKGRRQHLRARSDKCTWRTPRRTGGCMASRMFVQSWEGACAISVIAGMPLANSDRIWAQGLAHEVVVAMIPVITSRRSEGPLGWRGCRNQEDLGIARKGYQTPLGVVHAWTFVDATVLRKRPNLLTAAKPISNRRGKVIGEMRVGLKPDWGKPAVRDYRGGDGNGGR